MIRAAKVTDANEVCGIYNYYIANTIITFEEEQLTISEMQTRIKKIMIKYPWLVYEEAGEIHGYAYASEWKSRAAYRDSVEVTVYLKPEVKGKGIGSALYQELFKKLKEKGFHSFIGGISLPNPGSVALHEKFGFKKVAHFKEIGNKFNKWIDVGYWQLVN